MTNEELMTTLEELRTPENTKKQRLQFAADSLLILENAVNTLDRLFKNFIEQNKVVTESGNESEIITLGQIYEDPEGLPEKLEFIAEILRSGLDGAEI